MTIYTVNDDLLTSDHAAAYFAKGDRRIKVGLRAALELLRIPLPEYAKRQPAGPKTQGAVAVAARYAADNPMPRTAVLAPRKPNAPPEIIAEAKAAHAKRTGNLFNETFG